MERKKKGIIEEQQLKVRRGQSLYILIVCSLLYMINCMDRQVLAVVLEPMKQDLGLSDSQAGIIMTVFLLSIALFAFPISYLVDRWSRRKALGLMALFWSAFTFLTGVGRSFLGILVPRTLVGMGEAGFASGGTAMISAVYPVKERARAMGMFNAAIPLGIGLGVILGGFLSRHFGNWRVPFFIFAVPGIILGALALFMKDYRSVKTVDDAGRSMGLFRTGIALFRIPTLRWIYVGNAMLNVTVYSFLMWGPAYIMRAQGISEDEAGMLIGIVSLLAIIGAPLGGILTDYWTKRHPRGRITVPLVSMLVMSLAYVLTILFEMRGIGVAFAVVLGLVMVIPAPAFAAITQDVATPDRKGMAFGMNSFSMYVLGGGWAPLLIGYASDRLGGGAHGLKVALMFAGVGGIIGAVALMAAARHYVGDREKASGYVLQEDS
ncbi:MAG: MFS transporter [Spirochaetes bacterium]|nr:MFS transporter [Spirochaetota bacterium]